MILPFARTDTVPRATYALYGKLPSRPDFLRYNANHSAVLEFDQLIQEAYERLSHQPAQLPTCRSSEFCTLQFLSADRRTALLGVLAPSFDQAGRWYPLLAVMIVPAETVAVHTPVIPIAYEVFFDGLREQVATTIVNSVDAISCRSFLDAQSAADGATGNTLELAYDVVRRYTETTTVKRFCETISPESLLGLHQALLNIAFFRAFLRRFGNQSTNQPIVLPLPSACGDAALAASAWLSMLKALDTSTEPGTCRIGYAMLGAGSGARLAAWYGEAQGGMASVMLGGEVQGIALNITEEQEVWCSHPLYQETAYALDRLLGSPAVTVVELCQFLKDIGAKLAAAA